MEKPRRHNSPGLLFFHYILCLLLPRMRIELNRQANGVDGHRPDGVGKVLQTAAVFFYAVHEALMVVVGDGFDPREGVEVARAEAAVLAVELTEEHGGDVEVRQGRGPHLGVDDVGGGVGVPGCDDVEADGEVGILDVPSVGAPLEGLELDEDGNWEKVENKVDGVPAIFVPKKIADYIKSKYATVAVTKVDKEGDGYEVELSNRKELKFNKRFKLVKVNN